MQQPVYYRLSRTERIPLGTRYVDIPDALVAALLIACGGFAVAFILFSMVPLDWAGFPSVGRPEVFRFVDWYRSLDVAHQASFELRVSLALVIAVFGFGLGLWMGFQPKQTDEHVGGSRFMDGAAAIKAMRVATDAAIARTGQGIHLHPELPISLDTEVKHFMLVGAPGSGKTQTLHFLLKQLFKRGGKGDKMIIYDTKADFTAAYPQALLIAPWDARSPAWNIAKDCTTEGQARELATRFIADSKEPMWAEGTRAILVSLIVKLQTDNPMRWTWRDLADHIAMASADADLLVSWVQRFNPVQAAVVLGGSESKTVQSFMTTLAASATLIAQLAQAWESKSAKISFTQWLHDENPKYRQIILQGDGRFASLTKAYIGAIINLLSQEIQSPVFTDSSTRKLWFILDEAPKLGKVDIMPMIEVGRSKGVRVLACFQDQSQIREIYGDNVAKTWAASAGTMIIYRVNRGDTANWLAEEIIGTRTVRRNQTSESFTKDGRTVQRSQTEVKLPIVHPSDLENHLGPCDEGVRGLVLGLGVVGRLTWPYMPVKSKREKHKPAPWTLPKPQAMSVDDVVQRLEAAGQEAQADQETRADTKPPKMESDVEIKHAIAPQSEAEAMNAEQGDESALETAKAVAANVPLVAEAMHAVEFGKAVMNANAQPVGTVAPTFTALPIERLVKEPRGRRETTERERAA
jgi:DNA polymerase III delta prime subunit